MSTKTEKQKMMDGEMYDAFDSTLLRERNAAKQMCFELNQTSPLNVSKRLRITQQILSCNNDDNDNDNETNKNKDSANLMTTTSTTLTKTTSATIPPENPLVESPFHVDYGYNLHVGKNFYANHVCTILDCNRITIGDNCLLGPNVVITAATHPLDPKRRAAGEEYTRPIKLGNNCWLGANVTLLPGVHLGDGVVVGAGAVVTPTSCLPGQDNIVLAGVPAKIIKNIV